MLTIVATLTYQASRRITEVGALLGLLGGLALAGAALRSVRRWGLVVGGVLLVLGFALMIYAIHFGVSPYRAVVVK